MGKGKGQDHTARSQSRSHPATKFDLQPPSYLVGSLFWHASPVKGDWVGEEKDILFTNFILLRGWGALEEKIPTCNYRDRVSPLPTQGFFPPYCRILSQRLNFFYPPPCSLMAFPAKPGSRERLVVQEEPTLWVQGGLTAQGRSTCSACIPCSRFHLQFRVVWQRS